MRLCTSIGVYVLALVMVIQAFLMPIVYLDFKLRQDYIAKVLCVNRNKPEMHCNGQCILMQRMKKAQQTAQLPRNQNAKNEIFWLSCCFVFQYDFAAVRNLNSSPCSFYLNLYHYYPLSSLFHPPRLA